MVLQTVTMHRFLRNRLTVNLVNAFMIHTLFSSLTFHHIQIELDHPGHIQDTLFNMAEDDCGAINKYVWNTT